MLTTVKRQKLIASLKDYRKKFLDGKITELDESGTRIMINSFLADVLGFKQLEEIKTEYMIRGTYADYMVQVDKIRYFLVEVKALSFALTDKHLRQVLDYGAKEGVDYALLTNGKDFQFYKIIFGKPVNCRLVFKVDLGDSQNLKDAVENFQHLHRDSVTKNNFRQLWSKCEATDPYNVSGILCSDPVLKLVGKLIKQKYNEKCDDDSLLSAVQKIISEKMDPQLIKPFKGYNKAKVQKQASVKSASVTENREEEVNQIVE
jgi:hypothetical protein